MKEIVATIFKEPKRINGYGEELQKFSWSTDVNKEVRAQYAKTPLPRLIKPFASKGICFLEPSELNVEDLCYDEFKERYGFEYFKNLPPNQKARFTAEIAASIFKTPQHFERYQLELRHAVTCDEVKAALMGKYVENASLLVFQRTMILFQQRIFGPEDQIPSSGSFKQCFEQQITSYEDLTTCATTYGHGFYASGFVSEAHVTKIFAQHFKLNAAVNVCALAEQKVNAELPQAIRKPLETAREAVIQARNSDHRANFYGKFIASKGTYRGKLNDEIGLVEALAVETFVTQMDLLLVSG